MRMIQMDSGASGRVAKPFTDERIGDAPGRHAGQGLPSVEVWLV